MKRIMLIRHGNTDKTIPGEERPLSDTGIIKMKNTADAVKKFIKNGRTVIASTRFKRARQSAEILRSALGLKSALTIRNLRIKNIHLINRLITENELKGIRPAQTFLSIKNPEKVGVESARQFFVRVRRSIFKMKEENIILISHECSLEAFMQNIKNEEIIFKTFNKFFEYGDFAVLDLNP